MHRKVASKDHKLVYWVAGGISALSVLLEKKARRSELALYVLPRAGDSLWYILVNRHLLPNIKNAEVLPFFYHCTSLKPFLDFTTEKTSIHTTLHPVITPMKKFTDIREHIHRMSYLMTSRPLQVPLFCACMGGIMYYLEHEPDTMAPFLRGLIRRFLASRISNPGPPSSRTASYTYLQTLDALKKPKLQEAQEPPAQAPAPASASEKYNLESIPGL